ncbi:MAG: hypothetical protein DKT66_20140 [Candidatus Melainabacteria bacterium]|nr:MAG: hypothetical protein DKT66_20140 [Candidatus Melainabacteria bacterium]
MKFFEQEANSLNQMMLKLDQLSKYSAKELAQKVVSTGDSSGEEAFFDFVISAAKEAKTMHLTPGVGNALHSANSSLDPVIACFQRIGKLDPALNDSQKQNLVAETRDRFKESYPTLVALRGYGLSKSALQNAAKRIADAADNCNSQIEAIGKDREEIEKWHSDKMQLFDANLKELGNEIDKVKDLISKLGVATYAARFEEESKEHEKESRLWLDRLKACAWIFLVASGLVLFVEYAQPHAGDGIVSWFSSTASRLVILSLPSIGLFLCMRNYAACRHNYIVNKHRQNALSTFHLFQAAATDEETKKAVMLQSLQAIFSPQSSGYLKSAADSQPSSQFIELINKTVKDH